MISQIIGVITIIMTVPVIMVLDVFMITAEDISTRRRASDGQAGAERSVHLRISRLLDFGCAGERRLSLGRYGSHRMGSHPAPARAGTDRRLHRDDRRRCRNPDQRRTAMLFARGRHGDINSRHFSCGLAPRYCCCPTRLDCGLAGSGFCSLAESQGKSEPIDYSQVGPDRPCGTTDAA